MDRGYEKIEEKLRGVGAQIRRMGNIFPQVNMRRATDTSPVPSPG
jgi:UDP-N-acetylglucosamine 1-carboxyvinyltransferase